MIRVSNVSDLVDIGGTDLRFHSQRSRLGELGKVKLGC